MERASAWAVDPAPCYKNPPPEPPGRDHPHLVDGAGVGSKLVQRGPQCVQQVLVLHIDHRKAIQHIAPASGKTAHAAGELDISGRLHVQGERRMGTGGSCGRRGAPLHPVCRKLQALDDLVQRALELLGAGPDLRRGRGAGTGAALAAVLPPAASRRERRREVGLPALAGHPITAPTAARLSWPGPWPSRSSRTSVAIGGGAWSGENAVKMTRKWQMSMCGMINVCHHIFRQSAAERRRPSGRLLPGGLHVPLGGH